MRQHSTHACLIRVLSVAVDIGWSPPAAGLYFLIEFRRIGRLAGNRALLPFATRERHLRNAAKSDRAHGSDIGIHVGACCLFFRYGSSSSTPLAQLGFVQLLPVHCDLFGILDVSWNRVPSCRTQAKPSCTHEVMPAPLASAQ